ncbi:MAG: hypothetical protein AAFR66_12460 [Bacteroidota bacterium]
MDNLELDYRYVVNGRVSHYPPDSNYVKLDASRLPYLGECIWVCWDENGLDWEVAVAKTSILENKLDTTRFRVNTSLPVGSLGIPTEKKYRKENCAIFSFYDKALSPDERGAIVEFHH